MEKSSKPENKRVERIKKILELENITQQDLADSLTPPMEPQNFSRILKTGKVTEKTCRKIIAVYPQYRLEWLLGYDDDKTIEEVFEHRSKYYSDFSHGLTLVIDSITSRICRNEGIEEFRIDDKYPIEYVTLRQQIDDAAYLIIWNFLKNRDHSSTWKQFYTDLWALTK